MERKKKHKTEDITFDLKSLDKWTSRKRRFPMT